MPKVLALVSFKIFPAHMGGQKGVALFYKHLDQHSEVYMAACTGDDLNTETSYPVSNILFHNRMMPFNLLKIKKLVAWIRAENMECIIAEHSYTGWIAYLLSKICRIPFIIHSHNIEARRFQLMGRWGWKLYYRYERWIHQKADHSFFISPDDKKEGVVNFKLNEFKCTVIPYGVENISTFTQEEKQSLRKKLGVSESTSLLYFNGTLDYKPNVDAVEILVREISPRLKKKDIDFKIIITGNRISEKLYNLISAEPNIIYAGFVKDVSSFYNIADVFLNTVVNNSGTKTKVIEAIALHCPVVSPASGANGIPTDICGNKLNTVKNGNWDFFSEKVIKILNEPKTKTPQTFYDYFYWDNIASKASAQIELTIKNG